LKVLSFPLSDKNTNRTEYQISPQGARPGITGPILYVKTDKYPTGNMKTGHTHLATINIYPKREKITWQHDEQTTMALSDPGHKAYPLAMAGKH